MMFLIGDYQARTPCSNSNIAYSSWALAVPFISISSCDVDPDGRILLDPKLLQCTSKPGKVVPTLVWSMRISQGQSAQPGELFLLDLSGKAQDRSQRPTLGQCDMIDSLAEALVNFFANSALESWAELKKRSLRAIQNSRGASEGHKQKFRKKVASLHG